MSDVATHGQPAPRRYTAAADFWLNLLFWQARSTPIIGSIAKPIAIRLAWRCSEHVRAVTNLNARRIFGPGISNKQAHAYATGMLSHFFDFVCEVGKCVGLSDQQLREQVESVSGQDAYDAARAAGKGAIIATATHGQLRSGGGGASTAGEESACRLQTRRHEPL